MMISLITATTLILSAAQFLTPVAALACVQFDIDWNLYAFGIGGADYNLGDSSSWSNGQAKKLTTTGRPPFDGPNTQCFLSQFENAIYVINGDQANPSDIQIYDANGKSWTTQKINMGGADPSSLISILDHDTNVFFSLSGGSLYQLDFGQMTAAVSKTLNWESVSKPGFSTDNYSPVMALAQNHVHFLNVPNSSAGQAYIFVIHFAYFQPTPQSYPATSGSNFPVTHGKTSSFFQKTGVQEQFAFIPDDGSATYVVNVKTNTTTPLAGPTKKDAKSVYATSDAALVQLTSDNELFFLPYNQNSPGANSNAAWKAISFSAGGGGGGGGGSSTGSGSSTGTAGQPTGMQTSTSGTITGSPSSTGSGSASPSSTSSTGGALSVNSNGALASLGLVAIAALVML